MRTLPTGKSPARSLHKLVGVVVTYIPEGDLQRRLEAMASQVDSLVIVDNSDSRQAQFQLVNHLSALGAHLIVNETNVGVATALNQGVAFARTLDATEVAFFDQDSSPYADFRSEMEAIKSNYSERKVLGIMGCNYLPEGSIIPHYSTECSTDRNYSPSDAVITAGSVYAMSMLTKLGPFRDSFFIDGVDTEYCWRALSRGYGVCRSVKPLMSHGLGLPSSHVLFGCRVGTSNHPAYRRYFMARNFVFLFRTYFFQLPHAALALAIVQSKSVILMLLFEREKFRKLNLLTRGIWHGLVGRTDYNPAGRRP